MGAIIREIKRRLTPTGIRRLRDQRTRKVSPKKRRLSVLRLVLTIGVIALLTYLFPRQKSHRYSDLHEGDVVKEKIIAPFLFPIKKSEREYRKEQEEAERSVLPLIRYDREIGARQLAALDSLFEEVSQVSKTDASVSEQLDVLKRENSHVANIFDDTIEYLLRLEMGSREEGSAREDGKGLAFLRDACYELLSNIYAKGVVQDKATIVHESAGGTVSLLKDGEEREIVLADIVTQEKVENVSLPKEIDRIISDEQTFLATKKVCYELVVSFLSPNLIFDREETERRRDEARRNVARTKGFVIENEKIIDANERITAEHMEILSSLAEEIAQRELKDPLKKYYLLLARALVCSFLIFSFLAYLYVFRRQVYEKLSFLVLFAIIVVAPVAVASYGATHSNFSMFMVPVALSAMLATVLFDAEVGLALTFMISFFTGAVLSNFQITLVSALCGAVAVYSVRKVRYRSQFYRSMIYLPLSYAVVIATTDVLRFLPYNQVVDDMLPGILVGFASPVLTMGLLRIFESLFGITTDMTLLELSDLNLPLLKELSTRAPGTYSHSIIVANLSEAAAEAIGENPLLARVGSYYHDIGKMLKPQYFVENQNVTGRNAHDRLTPRMSALVIASHVKDGLELAEEHGLPAVVRDLIPQHQGTTMIKYFYTRAVEMGNEVRKDDFRYPGPKPQTKIAGIIMLADSVEAASRTLRERNPNRIRGLARTIIQEKFTDLELSECDLTFRDLSLIEGSFVTALMGAVHPRVEYPWQKAQEHERKRVRTSTG